MNKHVKEFFHRGLIFGGFGPIVMAIVYFIISCTDENFSLSGVQVMTAIISTYILAFIHAGSSVFPAIEHWPIMKSMLCQFVTMYVAYTSCYLINSWIPFDINIIFVFTGIFVAVFFAIWLAVLISVRITKEKMNKKL